MLGVSGSLEQTSPQIVQLLDEKRAFDWELVLLRFLCGLFFAANVALRRTEPTH